MGTTDTIVDGEYLDRTKIVLKRSRSTLLEGFDPWVHEVKTSITEGSSEGQASAVFMGVMEVPYASAATVSLANADPFGDYGDATWTSASEGLKLKRLQIENCDSTGVMTVSYGANPIPTFLSGATSGFEIHPKSCVVFTWWSGTAAINDGVDDEFQIVCATTTGSAKITAVVG